MIIYNSKTKQKEQFIPQNKNEILMYVCGPTLYSEIHIGNARPLIFFDVVARYFKHLGYNVKYISNITDIDDKIINESQKQGISEEQLVANNIMSYKKVRNDMNLLNSVILARVTDYIQEIIEYIQALIKKDFAYCVNGSVYFRVNKVDSYGEISKQVLTELEDLGRIENDINKEYEHDFVLWKKTNNGITWDSPFGAGRPGWHTECVVMINELLGKTIDIHGGGVDLKFPHHENENAQAHACGNQLANIWMHNGFVNIDNVKMSKSIGNVIYSQAIIDEYGTNFLRLLMLKSSYTSPINITNDIIEQVTKDCDRIKRNIREYGFKNEYHESILISNIENEINNDFNTANALALYFKYMSDDYSDSEKKNVQSFIFQVFGFVDENEKIPQEIFVLIEARTEAKKAKDFQRADEIRRQINEAGYEVEDTREGVKCYKN